MMLENLLAWIVQVFVVAGIGTLLPALFRLRDPRWQPRYYQGLLGLCLLLPVVQPWPSEIIVVRETTFQLAQRNVPILRSPAAPVSWNAAQIVLAAFAIGVFARLFWLSLGLLRLRRLRLNAQPLYPLPEAVEEARESTGADAVICLAADKLGPVTFGLSPPVVLLPLSFLELTREAQFAVACHELLHVRRQDWAQHMVEECISILLWFHPAVWWLVSRIRLSREQAVDRQVVQLTQTRESYVDALLTMSGARPSLDLAPAPLFLRRRHLVARIASLVEEVSMSNRRLISSYACIGAGVTAAIWATILTFPLRGQPQVRTESAPGQQRAAEGKARLPRSAEALPPRAVLADSPGISVNPGGTILHRAGVVYPAEAARAGISGIVALDLSLDAGGNVVDARVVSGPEQLRRAALQSALQWHYETTGARTVQATIDFAKPPAVEAAPAVNPAPAAATSDWILKVDLSRLPQSQQDLLRPRIAPLEGRPFTRQLHEEVLAIVREVEPHATGMRIVSEPASRTQILTVFAPGELPGAGGAAASYGPELPPPPEGTQRIRVGGAVQAAKLLNKADPEYPPLARQARIQGVVRFHVLLDTEGSVKNLQLISGHPLLVKPATEAIQQYKWQTTLLNGNKVEVATQVDVNFTLNE